MVWQARGCHGRLDWVARHCTRSISLTANVRVSECVPRESARSDDRKRGEQIRRGGPFDGSDEQAAHPRVAPGTRPLDGTASTFLRTASLVRRGGAPPPAA